MKTRIEKTIVPHAITAQPPATATPASLKNNITGGSSGHGLGPKILARCVLCLPALALLLAMPSPAQNTVWTNAAGGDWNTAVNWNPNIVPAVGTNVFLTNNSPAYIVSYTNPMVAASIGSVSMSATGRVTLVIATSGFTLSGSGPPVA